MVSTPIDALKGYYKLIFDWEWQTYHRDVSNQSLLDDSTKQMCFENGIVLAVWAMRIFKNVQRITPIACPSMSVSDRIFRIGMHLRKEIGVQKRNHSRWLCQAPRVRERKEHYLVNYKVHLILEKELTDVGKSFPTERAILMRCPFRKHFGMDVGRSSSVIAWEDRYTRILERVQNSWWWWAARTRELCNTVLVCRPGPT